MDCRNLNERTYNRIENILEGANPKENASQNTFYRSTYGPATLINNWLENRTNNEEYPVGTESFVSEQMDKFRFPCTTKAPDRREYFNKMFEGYGYGQELLIDHLGFSYYGNYVSTYDLCYNHLAKGICGPLPRRYYKGKYKPSTDLTLIYGNLTHWNLKEKYYKRVAEEQCIPDPISENQAEYILHTFSEVKKLNDFPSFKRMKVIY